VIILISNEHLPATDHVARLRVVEGRVWSAFWISAPVGIDLLRRFAFGGRLIGRTSDFESENLGSTPSPQAITLRILRGNYVCDSLNFLCQICANIL
jgi:hypothetical protein